MSDRKYRHSGYQDDDRDRQPQRPRGGGGQHQSRIEGAPRGRGLGSPGAAVFKCSNCGKVIPDLTTVDADRNCSSCGKPLRTCTNCSFFNPAARFECKKTLKARVENKSKANECPLFQPKTVRDLAVKETRNASNDPRSAFDALFKK
ncbi:MAG: hypothetical protein GY906_21875 [bacterium]|nr:hypothetical protein [bacterium]